MNHVTGVLQCIIYAQESDNIKQTSLSVGVILSNGAVESLTCTVWGHWGTWWSRCLHHCPLSRPPQPGSPPAAPGPGLHLLLLLQLLWLLLGPSLKSQQLGRFCTCLSVASSAEMMKRCYGLTARRDHKQQDSSLSPLIYSSARRHTVSTWTELWWGPSLTGGCVKNKTQEPVGLKQHRLTTTMFYCGGLHVGTWLVTHTHTHSQRLQYSYSHTLCLVVSSYSAGCQLKYEPLSPH